MVEAVVKNTLVYLDARRLTHRQSGFHLRTSSPQACNRGRRRFAGMLGSPSSRQRWVAPLDNQLMRLVGLSKRRAYRAGMAQPARGVMVYKSAI